MSKPGGTQKDRIELALSHRAMTVAEIVADTGINEGSVGAVLYGNQDRFEHVNMKAHGIAKRVWKLRRTFTP